MLATIQDKVALALVVLPLIVIAWAAVWFVLIEAERNRHERYKRFYSIMEQLSRSDGVTAAKMAAAYELRNYREYADIIAKIFVNGRVRDTTSDLLQKQLRDTLEQIAAHERRKR
jgi:hypothetical protein